MQFARFRSSARGSEFLASFPAAKFEFARINQVGDETKVDTCIRCTAADNALKVIGQHLQSSAIV